MFVMLEFEVLRKTNVFQSDLEVEPGLISFYKNWLQKPPDIEHRKNWYLEDF